VPDNSLTRHSSISPDDAQLPLDPAHPGRVVVAAKRLEIEACKAKVPARALESRLATAPPVRADSVPVGCALLGAADETDDPP
jgi:hypothetical protein